uniref:SMP-30/gluconolactonase/LRE family protein n=1 Tax=Shewanella baltica TaxID=62322 RepID=UPI004048417F
MVRYRPNGQVDLTLTLPVTNPTSIAIGGPNMDWLIITSAKHSLSAEQLSKESQAGNISIYQLQSKSIRGLIICGLSYKMSLGNA